MKTFFPIRRQYRVSTSTGWFLQQSRVKYYFSKRTENILSENTLNFAVCVCSFIDAQISGMKIVFNDLHVNWKFNHLCARIRKETANENKNK